MNPPPDKWVLEPMPAWSIYKLAARRQWLGIVEAILRVFSLQAPGAISCCARAHWPKNEGYVARNA
jgi:hypothetical protein